MVKSKKTKSAGRYGARYGKKVRTRIVEIESKQRIKQSCPFCKKTAKRISKGLWECKNKTCKKRFAAGTYYLE